MLLALPASQCSIFELIVRICDEMKSDLVSSNERSMLSAAARECAMARGSEAAHAAAVDKYDRLKEVLYARAVPRVREMMYRVTSNNEASAASAVAAAAHEQTLDRRVATMSCPNCFNTDPSCFNHEYKSGDVICIKCGAIASERTMHEGDWTRSFEGEDNESTLGPASDPLLSSRYNLRTGIAITPGMSFEGMRKMRIVAKHVEMGSSGSGGEGGQRSERRTREGYKDEQKLKVFERLERASERLGLSVGAVARAKQLFAMHRESREHVTHLDDVVAACAIAAVEELEFGRLQAQAETARAPQRVLASATGVPVRAAPVPATSSSSAAPVDAAAPAVAAAGASRPKARPKARPVVYMPFGGAEDAGHEGEDIAFARTHTLERPVLGSAAAEMGAGVAADVVQRLTANANDEQRVNAEAEDREEFRAPS